MGALLRSIDWSATPLGPMSGWSDALKITAGVMLRSRFPSLLWWGPKFVQIYNDAYVPIPGAKHPAAFGQTGSECWAEIWDIIGPMAEAPFRGGEATSSDDFALLIRRRGFPEECHFKLAYSPVPDETVASGIGGVLATVAETTGQVYGERQLRTLRELGARAPACQTPAQACQEAAATLGGNPFDVPFALFYLLDESGRSASLTGVCGFAEGVAHPAAPPVVELAGEAGDTPWPLRRVVCGRATQLVGDLEARFTGLPTGHWTDPPRTAVVLPLASPDQALAYGAVIVGMNPHRALDESYSGFFELAAAQVMTAIRNARAYQAERKRAESLAELDRAKTAFFSNVSHEFRTPLTLMLGPTEDLLGEAHGPLSGSQRAQLELIHRSQLRLHRLVNALLDFSRIEVHRLQARYEPVDLAALTRDLASAFRAAVERAGLVLDVDCPGLSQPIFVDRDMWEKIVLNLLSNAFKFTLSGSIVVKLRPRDDGVALEVKDSGVGIPAPELGRVFERFHRIEGTPARTHEGSGIGLALVSELVKLHGGSIAVESEVERGTTFTVTLPRGRGDLPETQVGAHPASAAAAPFVEEALRWVAPDAPATAAPLATPEARILVADDNADMREYLTRLLAPRFEVEAVEDGARALEAVIARPPDLILTDVMMPNLDGFALLREVRKAAPAHTVPVVMLSARAGEEASIEGLQAGADDYLIKPFSARELFARVEAQLARSRLVAEITRQAALLDLSTEAVLAWDFEGGIVYWNAAASALYGFSREEALGNLPRALLATIFPGGVDAFLRELRRDGSWQGELIHHARGGDPVTVESRMRILSQRDRPLVLEVVRDIRDRKASEAEREARMRELEQTVRFSEMFVGVLGHDLRSPLAAIMTLADYLLCLERPPGEADSLGRIVHSARRMARMIDQLLDFTTIRLKGGLPLERVDTDLRSVVEATTEELRNATGCSIIVDLRGECRGRWDADRLAQLLSNLIGNACQHGTAGSPVRVSVDGSAADRLRIVVSNEGSIPPERRATLFEPLGSGRRTRKSSGLGLGLYITQQIALGHGGRVSVEPTQGTTTVTVELPRRPSG